MSRLCQGGSRAASRNRLRAPANVPRVSPARGSTAGGNAVSIFGSNFTGVTQVNFGATAASFTINSPNQVTAVAPAESAGAVDVTATNSDGTSSTGQQDRYTFLLAP